MYVVHFHNNGRWSGTRTTSEGADILARQTVVGQFHLGPQQSNGAIPKRVHCGTRQCEFLAIAAQSVGNRDLGGVFGTKPVQLGR
jgi:hypothetical protein